MRNAFGGGGGVNSFRLSLDQFSFSNVNGGDIPGAEFLISDVDGAQRCWGPTCSAAVKIDIGGLANGDNAGIALFQRDYVSLSATKENGTSYLVLRRVEDGKVGEAARVNLPRGTKTVWVRAYGDFTRESEKDKLWNFPGRDEGWFAYSTDGKSWTPIGGKFHLEYTAPHFTGYRFALYMYSTVKPSGHADFDWFRLSGSAAR